MRTSKISRDTARVMSSINTNTMRPSTRSSSLRSQSLSHFMRDSAVSTSPTHTETTDATSQSSAVTQSLRKRKRGVDAVVNTVKVETTTTTTTNNTAVEPPSTPQRKRRTPAKVKRSPSGNISTAHPPSHWQEMYDLVRSARLANPVAPVDTMGCERLADTDDSPRAQRFQTLISLMLSSQTKDTVTAVAVRRMQRELVGGLCLESILAVAPEMLDEMIGKVGFHNTKTKNIKRTAEILRDEWDGDIPDTIEGLVSLPGVGPKMGYLTLSAAWGRTEGIGVDVHVHRITNLWGWHKTKTPEETRMTLQAWLPKDRWHEINHMLVGHGQTVCLPVGRKCGDCVLGVRGLCPSAVGVKRVKKEEEAKLEIKVEGDHGVTIEETTVVKEKVQETPIKQESMVDIEDCLSPARRGSSRKSSRKGKT